MSSVSITSLQGKAENRSSLQYKKRKVKHADSLYRLKLGRIVPDLGNPVLG